MKKINFKIIWKKIKHSFTNIGSDADKDWRIILTLFFVLFVASVVWNVGVYLHIYDVPPVSDTTNQGINKAVNADSLSKMLDIYDKRGKDFQAILDNKKVFVDPSL